MIRRRVVALIAFTLAFALPASAQQDARLARAIDALRMHADTSGVAGLAAAIHVDGARVWSGGFGWSDIEQRVPMSDSTVSRIGSISKSVAAVAAMILVDRGELDLDAPIATYLPDYPRPQAERMTMRQIMSHSAGIRHYRGEEFASAIRYDDVFAPLAVFAGDSLLFAPGTDYGYSTYGYTVVSAVTERADGRPWTRIIRDEVARPLGLRTLQPEWRDSLIMNRASYYDRAGDGWINTTPVDNSNKWAGGGLVSDVRDLAAFGQAIADGRLLSANARGEMWTKQTPEGEASYGLGWNVSDIEGHRVVGHSGGSMGATAMLIVLPEDDVVVAVLGNSSDISHGGIAARVARILLGVEN
ncbi:MAG TPA: serine hydrolase domain-containing protein [Longimicrobiales bacterium]